MHQTFQNSIDFFFYSLDSSVSYWVFSWLEYSWEWNCQAIWWVKKMPFEKKSVDIGFAPVNEVLKAVPILWCEIWEKSEAAEKKHLVKLGSILKLELECLLGIEETSSSQYLFLLAYTDISTMIGGIFLVFHFLKKIYSVSTTIILNKVIIFYSPLNIFWRWHFMTFKN